MAYSEDLAKRMRLELRRTPGLEEKKMFGGIGFLVHGNMACGVHAQDLIVRLGAAEYESALKKPHVKVFDMTGRPMTGWIVVKPGGYASKEALQGWIRRGVKFANSLPPK